MDRRDFVLGQSSSSVASARRVVASVLGIAAGIAGIEHGVFEVLQGNVRPTGVVIASIGPPCVPEEAWNACEPAMTIVPNLLATGIVDIILGLLVTVWSAAFVQRKHGGMILILLSIALLLFGGGFFPPVISIVAGVVGTQVSSCLTWWRARRSRGAVRLLSSLWPWVLIVFLLWVVGQWVIGYLANEWLMRKGYLIFVFVLGPLVLSPFAALAHDTRHHESSRRA